MTIKELWALTVADTVVNKGNAKAETFYEKLKSIIYLLWFSPSFVCVFYFRINQYLAHKHNRFAYFFARTLEARRIYKFGNDISMWAQVGPGLRLVHLSGIVIGRRVIAGKNLTLLNDVTLGERKVGDDKMPKIGHDVYIGTGAKILGGITIGDNVVLGALTFCNKSLPSNSVAYRKNSPLIVDIQ